MHTLLLRSILTTIAGKEYAAQLRQFPFPTGYSRLQSPLHHLKSYSLSDHGRWAMVIPVLLRCWLTDSHLSPRYREALQQFGLNPVWSIVKGYAAMAKSTSCLMSDCLNPLERANLGSIVKAARRHYQTLLDAAINATGRGHRASAHVSRSPSPMGALQAIEPMLPLSQVSQTSVSANTAEQYNNDKRRPNVHTALHYEMLMSEYAVPANCNVLIGEDKHRWFKKVVYNTNHSNVERVLLSKENLRQTVRLLLANAFLFDHAEQEITLVFQELYQECPTLFDTILPRSEQGNFDEEVAGDSLLSTLSTTNHINPSAIGRYNSKYCRDILQVPIRSCAMDESFKTELRRAYELDYQMSGMYHFGTAVIQWCHKFSFMSRYVVFSSFDFVTAPPLVVSLQPWSSFQVWLRSLLLLIFLLLPVLLLTLVFYCAFYPFLL
jgi:hypothetical protein